MGDEATWVLTGLSGAGKAVALRALERRGVDCVDNLPVEQLAPVAAAGAGRPRAVVVDARGGEGVRELIPPRGVRVLFLDARDDVLLRRLGDSSRPHPCAAAGSPPAAIAAERELLTALRGAADVVLDTSELGAEELATRVVAAVVVEPPATALVCTVSSFGFKFGAQAEADWVADARVLPNPFWEPELRPLTGLDAAVRDYVFAGGQASQLLERLLALLDWALVRAAERGRARVHVAVGCTGGRHRSVVIAEALAARLRGDGVDVVVRHRDVDRPDPR